MIGAGGTVTIAGCADQEPDEDDPLVDDDDGDGMDVHEDPDGVTFNYAKAQPLTHMDPQAINDGTMVQLGLVYDQLLDYAKGDPTTIRPALATDYESVDGGSEWVLQLREGVEFHDGTSFDAYAAKRSLERAKALDAGQSKPYDWVESVEETGDLEITIYCDGEFGPAPAALTFITTSIMNPTAIDEHWDDDAYGHEYFQENTHGTGPFQLENWQPEEIFVAERVSDHWRDRIENPPDNLEIPEDANVDVYRNHIVREQLTQKQQLARGDVDVPQNLDNRNIEDVIQEDRVTRYNAGADMYNKYIFMMCQREPTSDVEFRKALAYAADYQGIAEDLIETAVPWGTPWAEGIWPRVTEGQYRRDLDRAEEHLENSVYDGGELTFRSIQNPENDQVGEALISNFAEIGVEVDHRAIPWADLFEQLSEAETMPDLLMYTGWPDYADPNGPAIRYWGEYWPADGWNTAYYQNERYDELFVEARSSGDRAHREELYTEMQEILLDEVPIIWLFQDQYVVPHREEITNMSYTPATFNYLDVAQFNKDV